MVLWLRKGGEAGRALEPGAGGGVGLCSGLKPGSALPGGPGTECWMLCGRDHMGVSIAFIAVTSSDEASAQGKDLVASLITDLR